jgi:hypothetical protein
MASAPVVLLGVATAVTRRGTPIALSLMVVMVAALLLSTMLAVLAKVGPAAPLEPLFAMAAMVHSPPTRLANQPTSGGVVPVREVAAVAVRGAMMLLVQTPLAEVTPGVALTNNSTPKSTVVPVERVVPVALRMAARPVALH